MDNKKKNPWIVVDINNSSRVSKLEFKATRTINPGNNQLFVIGNLRVTFKNNGSRYMYYDITKAMFEQIISSESVGKALQVIVGNKDIKYEKL